MQLMKSEGKIMSNLNQSNEQIASDHVVVLFLMSERKEIPRGCRPIPKWIAAHPSFGQSL